MKWRDSRTSVKAPRGAMICTLAKCSATAFGNCHERNKIGKLSDRERIAARARIVNESLPDAQSARNCEPLGQ